MNNSPDTKKRASGWTYETSEALGMKFAHRVSAGGIEVMTEDKVRYSPQEVLILRRIGGISKPVHLVKKVFEGKIIK